MASAGTGQRVSAIQAVKDAVAAIALPMVIGLEISEALTAQDEAAVSGIARDVFLKRGAESIGRWYRSERWRSAAAGEGRLVLTPSPYRHQSTMYAHPQSGASSRQGRPSGPDCNGERAQSTRPHRFHRG